MTSPPNNEKRSQPSQLGVRIYPVLAHRPVAAFSGSYKVTVSSLHRANFVKSITLSQPNMSSCREFVRYSCHFEHAGLPNHDFPLHAPRVFLGKARENAGLCKIERKPSREACNPLSQVCDLPRFLAPSKGEDHVSGKTW